MDYMDIFQAYLDGSISISSAEIQMRNLAKNLQNSGKMGEHAKAILCITYFKTLGTNFFRQAIEAQSCVL